MVGSRTIAACSVITSRGVDCAGDRVDEHAAAWQRRERAELRAQGMRGDAWARVARPTDPWPKSPGSAYPAHQRRPAPRSRPDDPKRAVLRAYDVSGPVAVRPRRQRRGDHAQRVQVSPRQVGWHDDHDCAAVTAHVATHQDLHDLTPIDPRHRHQPRAKTMAVKHAACAERSARRPAAWAARRSRQLHARRAFAQPPLDVYAGSDKSKLAPSFQWVRSTTGARTFGDERGPPSPFAAGRHDADAPSFGSASYPAALTCVSTNARPFRKGAVDSPLRFAVPIADVTPATTSPRVDVDGPLSISRGRR